MKNISLSVVLVLLTCAFGAAQDTPKAEVFLGYTYLRANSASNVPAFSANGGSGQLVVNIGKHFGLVTDIGAVHNGNIGGYHTDTTLTNFMFGPRFPIRVSHRVIPYFQGLFGGVYAASSVNVTVPSGTVILPPSVTAGDCGRPTGEGDYYDRPGPDKPRRTPGVSRANRVRNGMGRRTGHQAQPSGELPADRIGLLHDSPAESA